MKSGGVMMSKELRRALADLKAAVKNPGPNLYVHHSIMKETRLRWPTLMRAIEQVLATPEVRKL